MCHITICAFRLTTRSSATARLMRRVILEKTRSKLGANLKKTLDSAVGWSGKEAALPPLPPLRTVLAVG